MNRRNFFQSILAGIGALVGRKHLPKCKASPKTDIATTMDRKKPAVRFEDFDEWAKKEGCLYCSEMPIIKNDAWCTTSYWDGKKFIQWRHLPYRDDEIIIDWIRCVQSIPRLRDQYKKNATGSSMI